VVGAGAGCRKADEAAGAGKAQALPVEKVTQRGPLRLTARTGRGEIAVGDRLALALEVTAPDGFEVVLPKPGQTLGELRVLSCRDQAGVPVQQGRQWRQEYELEADVPGEFEIPPLTVRYEDRRAGRPAATQASQPSSEISSEALKVKVASVLKGQFKPTEFGDIKGPVLLPWEWNRRWLWWALWPALAVAAIVAVMLLRRCRTRRRPAEPVVPPHVWALEQLRLLRGEQLVERNLVAEFYFRLTGIVRVYIERRFAVRAAEQTTEEFLVAAKDHPSLGVRYGGLLADFLQASDLVKFARYLPQAVEIDRAFATADTFVRETAGDAAVEPMESSSAHEAATVGTVGRST
jgi:hypothetical protein